MITLLILMQMITLLILMQMITLLILMQMITPADPSVDYRDCGSQLSAGPLTVGHTVRVSHRPWITVNDQSPDPAVDDHFH